MRYYNNSNKTEQKNNKQKTLDALAVKTAKRVMFYTKIAMRTISFIFNPITLTIFICILIWLIFSALLAPIGENTFSDLCENEIPILEKIDDTDLKDTVYGFLSDSKSSFDAAQISEMLDNRHFDFLNGKNSNGSCDNDCVLAMLNNNPNTTIGAWNFTGRDAIDLVEQAKKEGMQWYKSIAQLNYMKKSNYLPQTPQKDQKSRNEFYSKVIERIELRKTYRPCKVIGDGHNIGRGLRSDGVPVIYDPYRQWGENPPEHDIYPEPHPLEPDQPTPPADPIPNYIPNFVRPQPYQGMPEKWKKLLELPLKECNINEKDRVPDEIKTELVKLVDDIKTYKRKSDIQLLIKLTSTQQTIYYNTIAVGPCVENLNHQMLLFLRQLVLPNSLGNEYLNIADCGRFVASIIRTLDPDYPHVFVANQEPYLINSSKYARVLPDDNGNVELQTGDIIVMANGDSPPGHIIIVSEDGGLEVTQASFGTFAAAKTQFANGITNISQLIKGWGPRYNQMRIYRLNDLK